MKPIDLTAPMLTPFPKDSRGEPVLTDAELDHLERWAAQQRAKHAQRGSVMAHHAEMLKRVEAEIARRKGGAA